jgi:hypothetical protein
MGHAEIFDRLGAPLHNVRWSWGSVRADGSVVLRVWQDEDRRVDGATYMRLTHHRAFQDRLDDRGYRERLRHVELLRIGAPCTLVMCRAKDVHASPRTIDPSSRPRVFTGGPLVDLEDDTWIRLGASVQSSSLPPTA